MFTSLSSCTPNTLVTTQYRSSNQHELDIDSNVSIIVNSVLRNERPIEINVGDLVKAQALSPLGFLNYKSIEYTIDGIPNAFAIVNRNNFNATVKPSASKLKWFNYIASSPEISFFQSQDKFPIRKLVGYGTNLIDVEELHIILDPANSSINFYSKSYEFICRVKLPAGPIDYRRIVRSTPVDTYRQDLIVLVNNGKLYKIIFDRQYYESPQFVPAVTPFFNLNDLPFQQDLPTGGSFLDAARNLYLSRLLPVVMALDVDSSSIWLAGSNTIYVLNYNFSLIAQFNVPGESITAMACFLTGVAVTTKSQKLIHVSSGGLIQLYTSDVLGSPAVYNNLLIVPDSNNQRLAVFDNLSGAYTVWSTPDFIPAYARTFNNTLHVTGHDSIYSLKYIANDVYEKCRFNKKVTLVSAVGSSIVAFHYLEKYNTLDLTGIKQIAPIEFEPRRGGLTHIGTKPVQIYNLGEPGIIPAAGPWLTVWVNGLENEAINHNDYVGVSFKASFLGTMRSFVIIGDLAIDYTVEVESSKRLVDNLSEFSNLNQLQQPYSSNLVPDIGNISAGTTSMALPFNFTLYRQKFNSINVSTNGYITFGNNFSINSVTTTTSLSNVAIYAERDQLYQGLPINNVDPLNIVNGILSTNETPGVYYKKIDHENFTEFRIKWIGTAQRFYPNGNTIFSAATIVPTTKLPFGQYNNFNANDYISGGSISVSTKVINKSYFNSNVKIAAVDTVNGIYYLRSDKSVERYSEIFYNNNYKGYVSNTVTNLVAGPVILSKPATRQLILDTSIASSFINSNTMIQCESALIGNFHYLINPITVNQNTYTFMATRSYSGNLIYVDPSTISAYGYINSTLYSTGTVATGTRLTGSGTISRQFTATKTVTFVPNNSTLTFSLNFTNAELPINLFYNVSNFTGNMDFFGNQTLSGSISVSGTSASLSFVANSEVAVVPETLTIDFTTNLIPNVSSILTFTQDIIAGNLLLTGSQSQTTSINESYYIFSNSVISNTVDLYSFNYTQVEFSAADNLLPDVQFINGTGSITFVENYITVGNAIVNLSVNDLINIKGNFANVDQLCNLTLGDAITFKSNVPVPTVSYEVGLYSGLVFQYIEIGYPLSSAHISANIGLDSGKSQKSILASSQAGNSYVFASFVGPGNFTYLGSGSFLENAKISDQRLPRVFKVPSSDETELHYEFSIDGKVAVGANVLLASEYGYIEHNGIFYTGFGNLSFVKENDFIKIKIPFNTTVRSVAPIFSIGDLQFALPSVPEKNYSSFVQKTNLYTNQAPYSIVTGNCTIVYTGDYIIPDYYIGPVGYKNNLVFKRTRSGITTTITGRNHTFINGDIITVEKLRTSRRKYDYRDVVIVGPESFRIAFRTNSDPLFNFLDYPVLDQPYVRYFPDREIIDNGNIITVQGIPAYITSNLTLSSNSGAITGNLILEAPNVEFILNGNIFYSKPMLMSVSTGSNIALQRIVTNYFENDVIVYQLQSDLDNSNVYIPMGSWPINNRSIGNIGLKEISTSDLRYQLKENYTPQSHFKTYSISNDFYEGLTLIETEIDSFFPLPGQQPAQIISEDFLENFTFIKQIFTGQHINVFNNLLTVIDASDKQLHSNERLAGQIISDFIASIKPIAIAVEDPDSPLKYTQILYGPVTGQQLLSGTDLLTEIKSLESPLHSNEIYIPAPDSGFYNLNDILVDAPIGASINNQSLFTFDISNTLKAVETIINGLIELDFMSLETLISSYTQEDYKDPATYSYFAVDIGLFNPPSQSNQVIKEDLNVSTTDERFSYSGLLLDPYILFKRDLDILYKLQNSSTFGDRGWDIINYNKSLFEYTSGPLPTASVYQFDHDSDIIGVISQYLLPSEFIPRVISSEIKFEDDKDIVRSATSTSFGFVFNTDIPESELFIFDPAVIFDYTIQNLDGRSMPGWSANAVILTPTDPLSLESVFKFTVDINVTFIDFGGDFANIIGNPEIYIEESFTGLPINSIIMYDSESEYLSKSNDEFVITMWNMFDAINLSNADNQSDQLSYVIGSYANNTSDHLEVSMGYYIGREFISQAALTVTMVDQDSSNFDPDTIVTSASDATVYIGIKDRTSNSQSMSYDVQTTLFEDLLFEYAGSAENLMVASNAEVYTANDSILEPLSFGFHDPMNYVYETLSFELDIYKDNKKQLEFIQANYRDSYLVPLEFIDSGKDVPINEFLLSAQQLDGSPSVTLDLEFQTFVDSSLEFDFGAIFTDSSESITLPSGYNFVQESESITGNINPFFQYSIHEIVGDLDFQFIDNDSSIVRNINPFFVYSEYSLERQLSPEFVNTAASLTLNLTEDFQTSSANVMIKQLTPQSVLNSDAITLSITGLEYSPIMAGTVKLQSEFYRPSEILRRMTFLNLEKSPSFEKYLGPQLVQEQHHVHNFTHNQGITYGSYGANIYLFAMNRVWSRYEQDISVTSTVNEGNVLYLQTPPGYVFSSVEFASFGLPEGSGGVYAVNQAAHAAGSLPIVQNILLGTTGNVAIPATESRFGNVYTPGKTKRLSISATVAPATRYRYQHYPTIIQGGNVSVFNDEVIHYFTNNTSITFPKNTEIEIIAVGGGGGGGGGEYSGLYPSVPSLTYIESPVSVSAFLTYWNDSSTFSMTNFADRGPRTVHGPLNGKTFTLTIPMPQPHDRLQYRVQIHTIDSLDREPMRIRIDGVLWAEFTRNYNDVPVFTVNKFQTYEWKQSNYSDSPWPGITKDGYIQFDTGIIAHSASTVVIEHYCGLDQSIADESAYLSNVELYVPPMVLDQNSLPIIAAGDGQEKLSSGGGGGGLVSGKYTVQANTTLNIWVGGGGQGGYPISGPGGQGLGGRNGGGDGGRAGREGVSGGGGGGGGYSGVSLTNGTFLLVAGGGAGGGGGLEGTADNVPTTGGGDQLAGTNPSGAMDGTPGSDYVFSTSTGINNQKLFNLIDNGLSGPTNYRSYQPQYGDYLMEYGVWELEPTEPVFTRSYSVNFPSTDTYVFSGSVDDKANVYLDGTRVLEIINYALIDSAAVIVTAGTHTIDITATNLGGPGSVAFTIEKGTVNGGGGGGGGGGKVGGRGQLDLTKMDRASGGSNYVNTALVVQMANVTGREGDRIIRGLPASYKTVGYDSDLQFNGNSYLGPNNVSMVSSTFTGGNGGVPYFFTRPLFGLVNKNDLPNNGQDGLVVIKYRKPKIYQEFVLYEQKYEYSKGSFSSYTAAATEAAKYTSATPFLIPGTNYWNYRIFFNTHIYAVPAKPDAYFYEEYVPGLYSNLSIASKPSTVRFMAQTKDINDGTVVPYLITSTANLQLLSPNTDPTGNLTIQSNRTYFDLALINDNTATNSNVTLTLFGTGCLSNANITIMVVPAGQPSGNALYGFNNCNVLSGNVGLPAIKGRPVELPEFFSTKSQVEVKDFSVDVATSYEKYSKYVTESSTVPIAPTFNEATNFQQYKEVIDFAYRMSPLKIDQWQVGSGPIPGYNFNQTATGENALVLDTDPWGNTKVIWETRASGDGNADGGWNHNYFAIDKNKTYRSTVWVRRTSTTSGGTVYHGLFTNGTAATYPNPYYPSGSVIRLTDGLSEGNPYWDYASASTYDHNVWYLLVGYIFPADYPGSVRHPESGVYTRGQGKVFENRGNIPQDGRFPSNATQAMQRCYHYYCSDSTTTIQFAYPKFEEVTRNILPISIMLEFPPYEIPQMYNKASTKYVVARRKTWPILWNSKGG